MPFQPELLPAEGNRRDGSPVGHGPGEPRSGPRHRQPRLGVDVRPAAGRAGRRPGAAPTSVPSRSNILADDFVAHGFDLQRLIRVIAALEVFRLDSALDAELTEAHEKAWAVFPLTRLRPEQVAGGVLQAASLTTIDAESPILVRSCDRFGHAQFVGALRRHRRGRVRRRRGHHPAAAADDERRPRPRPDQVRPLQRRHAASAAFAPDDRAAVEIAYLTVLTRRPTPEELAHFEAKLAGTKGKEREERMSDIFWTLVNATEFSWNH